MKSSLVRATVAAASAFAVAGASLLAYQYSTRSLAPREPVLVELFTSTTCPKCPYAEGAVASLVEEQPVRGAKIVPMALHVAFDNLPVFKDPLSNPEFVARQEKYAASMPDEALFTPFLVVDGVPQAQGCSRADLENTIEQAARLQKGRIEIALLESPPNALRASLQVTPMHRSGCDVYVALVEDGIHNPGLPMDERTPKRLDSVVRGVRLAAHVPPGDEEYMTQVELPIGPEWDRESLTLIAFAQHSEHGGIVAVGTAPLAK